MSLVKLLKTIDNSFLGEFVGRKERQILNSNPDKIYVENIRAFFGFSFRVAKFFCDLAVRAGYFTKHIGYVCPNLNCQKMLFEKRINEEFPHYIDCTNCEIREEENYSFDVAKLKTIVFYRLVKGGKHGR